MPMVWVMATPPPAPPPLPETERSGFWKRVIVPPTPEPGHASNLADDFESWLDRHAAAKTVVYLIGVLFAALVVVFLVAFGLMLLRTLFGWMQHLF